MWKGRFSESTDAVVRDFTQSLDLDWVLAPWDIAGSLAHARMLGQVGLLEPSEVKTIEESLMVVRDEIASGAFKPDPELEDVHMNIESRLTDLAGPVGAKLHTGRSRNDQVATDLRLWLRGEIDAMTVRLRALRSAFVDLAERHAATIMPGFTHMQVAQPVTFGHHLLAYEAMFARDSERLAGCRGRVNRMPLGSAALAGPA